MTFLSLWPVQLPSMLVQPTGFLTDNFWDFCFFLIIPGLTMALVGSEMTADARSTRCTGSWSFSFVNADTRNFRP